MKPFISFSLALLLVFLFHTSTMAQLGGALKSKIKNAAKSALENELKGGKEANAEEPPVDTPEESTAKSTVKGKKLKPPSVPDHLSSAESALKNEQYTSARFDVKEAMRGVELEIGYAILEAMPDKVDELTSNTENDQVTSTGIGFAGLVVSRSYENDEKQITASVGSNSALGASYSMLMSSGYGSDGNYKNVTVQGYRGTLTFDESSTYTLGIPFGQNGVFVLECYGCADEDELIKASNAFEVKAFDDQLKDSESDMETGKGAEVYITSASASYSSKDLESARFALQKAVEEIDIIIGKKILDMLPTELAGLTASPEADEHIASAAGFAGIYIERIYLSSDTTRQIEITLMDDSPLISMVNAFVNTPMVMGMSGKKAIKIDGYKGMYEPVEGSNTTEVSVSIPSNQSLLTMRFSGLNEGEINKAANTIPVGDIFNLLK